jgi:hypothetical protein
MTILYIVTTLFLILELANVLALYFRPDSLNFNSVGVFKAWEQSKAHPEIHDLIRYLTYWVAGTKLVFIALLAIILLTTSEHTQRVAALVMIPCIATFYWRLFPLSRKMGREGQLVTKNYDKVLSTMILVMLIAFSAASIIAW